MKAEEKIVLGERKARKGFTLFRYLNGESFVLMYNRMSRKARVLIPKKNQRTKFALFLMGEEGQK